GRLRVRSASRPLHSQSLSPVGTLSDSSSPSFKGDKVWLQLGGDIILEHLQYYTLMMSTGLTFGTISALFGLNHNVITQAQYSHLVATVIGSAVIPTVIANGLFLPRHLLPKAEHEPRREVGAPQVSEVSAEAE